MVFSINGVDITPYIKYQGLKWSRNDVEAANAGRMQNGEMQRDRVAIKYRFDVSCRPLTADEQATVLSLINSEFVSLTYTNPLTNTTTTGIFYSNNIPSTFMIRKKHSNNTYTEYWTGLTFPLIER